VTGGPDDISGNGTDSKFSIGGMPGLPGGSQSEIDSWVKSHGTPVQSDEWSNDGEFATGQLYDLKGGR
jgi:hypothetical protein